MICRDLTPHAERAELRLFEDRTFASWHQLYFSRVMGPSDQIIFYPSSQSLQTGLLHELIQNVPKLYQCTLMQTPPQD